MEHWYWKINDICNGSGSLARTTRRLKKSSKLVTQRDSALCSVDIGLCHFLLSILFLHRFTRSLNAFFYALFIPYTIFYSIYLIVQFLFSSLLVSLLMSPATTKINVYKLKRQEKEICIQVKLLYISLKQNRLKYNSWTWRQSRWRESAWERRK